MYTFSNNNIVEKITGGAAAGTTAVNGNSLDMRNYRRYAAVVGIGTIVANAVTSIKAQGSTDNSSWNDLAGTKINVADDDDDEIFVLEIVEPLHRYNRVVISRATQNATVQASYYIKGEGINMPLGVGDDVHTKKVVVSPETGTA